MKQADGAKQQTNANYETASCKQCGVESKL